jgi:hypothetical protein
MFASRACRSSVMIGKALNKDQMTKVVLSGGGSAQWVVVLSGGVGSAQWWCW